MKEIVERIVTDDIHAPADVLISKHDEKKSQEKIIDESRTKDEKKTSKVRKIRISPGPDCMEFTLKIRI